MKRYTDRQWMESMRISFDFNNMMADVIGEEEGIKKEDLDSMEDQLKAAAQAMSIKQIGRAHV